jgi:cytoskeleton protein RodZ
VDDGVGNKLRDARARRKLSLQEVEEATKIRVRYLQALENEDWDHLPGDTYARAFIRTYGTLLGLDGERLAEEQRRQRGSARPGERLPRVDPRPRRVVRRRRRRPRVPRQLIAVLVVGLLVAALVTIGLSGGEPDEPSQTGDRSQAGRTAGKESGNSPQGRESAVPDAHTLKLAADGEVWVCLLNGRDQPLVNGRILDPGDSEGPFRSGSFTLALGNGAVTMTVDGKQANLPRPPSPIGFAVDPRGSVRRLSEGERPTCT